MADESNDPKPELGKLACSFCGKSQKEVKKLIAGPSVYICDECISLCTDILAEERIKERSTRIHNLVELVGALDEQIVGHDEQKRIIAANLLRQARMGSNSSYDEARSILLVGPRGTGKSFLIELASTFIGLPVVVVDASRFDRFSSFEWEGLFKELMRKAGTSELAERGVICIEHIERALGHEAPDLARAIQRSVLDVTGGMMARVGSSLLDTTRIQLVFTVNLDGAPGAARGEPGRPSCGPRYGNPLRIQARDLVARGMEPELVDRMGVVCSFEPLSTSALEVVLRRAAGPMKRHVDRFEAHGIKVSFADDAMTRIAAVAANGDAGVRGLWQVLEAVASAIYCTVDPSAGEFVVRGDFVDECLLEP